MALRVSMIGPVLGHMKAVASRNRKDELAGRMETLRLRARMEALARLVEFHTCDTHDCKDHGNWAAGYDPGSVKAGAPAINGITHVGAVPIRAWLEDHGISAAVLKARGYGKWERTGEAGLDPAIGDAYGADMATMTQMRNAAAQTSGIIMPRHAVPGSPTEARKSILPQTRPDQPVIPAGEINAVRKELAKEGIDLERDVFDDPDSELAVKILKDIGAKYLFPAGKGNAARVDLPPDAENLKNFLEGKGRVYLAMEGSIKTDAVLTAVQREGEVGASVIGVPSVTLWHTPEMAWVAKQHLAGREIVLIPDADGVTNRNVRNQARAMQNLIETYAPGSKVLVASPPLSDSGEIIDVVLPSGKTEHLKGVDDWLGAGRGTLGGMTFVDRVAPRIDLRGNFEHGKVDKDGNAALVPIRGDNLRTMEDTLRAVAMLAEPGTGEVRVGQRTLGAAIGGDKNAAARGLGRLVALGILKEEKISEMSKARKAQLIERGVLEELPKGGDFYYYGGKRIKRKMVEQSFVGPDGKKVTISRMSDGFEPGPDTVADNDWATAEFDNPETPVYTIVSVKHRAKDAPLSKLEGRPGIKIIRTPEGAARYGGHVGDVIEVKTEGEAKKESAKKRKKAS